MNIIDTLVFNTEKPSVLAIHKSDKINLIAIGLLKNQLLKKHKAHIPTLLTILKGAIEFRIEDINVELKPFDTYQIPLNTEHEVVGLENENIFTLTQEK